MAARFWVGGAGTWSSTNTANWSASSGGAGGASVPGSADTPTFDANSGTGTVTFTNSAVTVGAVTLNSANITLSLGAALTSSSSITVTAGTFNTNGYNLTAATLSSNNSNTRAINLGASTVTLSNALSFNTATNLSFVAGTSQINLSSILGPTISGGGLSFYNVAYTGTNWSSAGVFDNVSSVNNLSIAARGSVGVNVLTIAANCSINGTLTISPGTDAARRTFVRSGMIGTPSTLTCAAIAPLTDIDFRDIVIAGAAAPVSGTRLGDCKGNSGITFDAPKTVFWRNATAANWSATTSWSATSGGTADVTQFPLAQDTAVFSSGFPNSGVTVTLNAAYNIGTIDMSARTSNTMTLATGSTTPTIYGDWINGTGTTLIGSGATTFAGRGSQRITSAGRTFTQLMLFDSVTGSVTLQDAFITSNGSIPSVSLSSGTLDLNGYNLTIANGGFWSTNTTPRTLALSSGTLTVGNSGNSFDCRSTVLPTVTGTGTISMTSASAKTFNGGGVQTYPTINQGGAGTLTITGSNKFANITNTAIGRVQFTGGTTNEFGAFNLNGVSGNLLQLGSTNTTQAILKKPDAWNVGANSTDGGNNTGLTFTGTDPNYLSISYINGEVVSPPSVTYNGAFFQFLV